MTVSAKKSVILLTGPTAAGKTALAIELAKHFSTEIISADSRQCFKELNIGVARPSEKELAEVPHHFIATHSIQDDVNAVVFETYALEKLNELFLKYNAVIVAGGTGLYIKALCEGFDEIPAIETEIRNRVIADYNEKGLVWLQEQVKVKDPLFYREGEIQNPQRMMRALEVVESTGTSILVFRRGAKAKRDFSVIKTGIELSKEELHRHIHARVDAMLAAGLLDEVNSLLPYRQLHALQTVGYTEIFELLDGKSTMEKATEEIKKNTRRYAKRQITWFRKDTGIKWFSPVQFDKMKKYISEAL